MTHSFALVGEAWGEHEATLHEPFVGPSGIELLSMLHDGGLIALSDYDREMMKQFWQDRNPAFTSLVWRAHPEIFRTNVFNLRPEKNDVLSLCGKKAEGLPGRPSLRQGKYIRLEYSSEITRLEGELKALRCNLVLALGNTAAWALLHNPGISKIRGTIFPGRYGPKVLPTYHPAAVLRQYDLRAVTVLDFAKARREATFPEVRRPARTIMVPDTLTELETLYDEHIAPASILAVDIETSGRQITCIGFSPDPARAIVIPFTDNRRPSLRYWQTLDEEVGAWEVVRRMLDHPAPKVFQNGLYDLHFLWRGYGLKVRNCEHDTMLLHHALQPESPKGLGFLGSVYTDEPAWKLMREREKETLKKED